MMALYSICLVVSVAQGREDIDVPSKNLKAGCILLRKSWNNRSICGHYVAATLPPEEGSAHHGDSIGNLSSAFLSRASNAIVGRRLVELKNRVFQRSASLFSFI